MNSTPAFLPAVKPFDWSRYDALIEEQYQTFSTDFVIGAVFFSGKRIAVKPIMEDGKEAIFWHLSTRKNKETGKREPDLDRLCRCHWLKPIVQNFQHGAVKYFQDDSKYPKHYFWLELDHFVLILEEKPRALYIASAHYVDKKYQAEDFKAKYLRYIS